MHSIPELRRARPAFTLLEVILALAILAGAVAILGELIRSAGRNATDVEAETRAQLVASMIMDEMVSGMTEPSEKLREGLHVKDTTPWIYSVSFESTEVSGLTAVEVVVEQDIEEKFRPVKYSLVRWLPGISIVTDESKEDESTDTASDKEGGSG